VVKQTCFKGFTLIELLIVVAIIAILAAIAIPNFLQAQTRAKISRARSDLRTISTALESYAVDHNYYPPNDWVHYENPVDSYSVVPRELTTPVAYLSTNRLYDPFADHHEPPSDRPGIEEEAKRMYTYHRIYCHTQAHPIDLMVFPEWLDGPAPRYQENALQNYGQWVTLSLGPDGRYSMEPEGEPPTHGAHIPYDPTNGLVSFGNIILSQHGIVEEHKE